MIAKLSTSIAMVSGLLVFGPVAQAMPMGGSYTGHVDSQAPQELGPNKVKVQQTASGVNTGPGTPFDGAKVQWKDTVTLENGQGPVQGTITLTTPSGTVTNVYEGKLNTDAQGRVTGQGTWKDSSATGEFSGIKGKGTFTLGYTSKTDFMGEWNGDVQLPRQKSSKR